MGPSSHTQIRLVTLDGGDAIVLGPRPIVIGRHPRCDIQLGSLQVSRHHCCATEVCGEVEVRDLGSTNGLWINGRRVTSGRLRPGDRLAIAHIEFRVEEGPDENTRPDMACEQER